MSRYVYNLHEGPQTVISEIGGKGANLMKLASFEAVKVPQGFCISTKVYKEVLEGNEEIEQLLMRLSLLDLSDLESVSRLSSQIRSSINDTELAADVVDEIRIELESLGMHKLYAVRSSATAEDLPMTSFAGQHDTFLNISGFDQILIHIKKCWASLFTDRAISYRIQNGFDHKKVYLAVVIQEMVDSETSGIMFTADPMTSNRTVTSIDVCQGLGEDLVSGLVDSNTFKVCGGVIKDKRILDQPFISDSKILALEKIGRAIEVFFGKPQDIEWCIVDGQIHVVQSRPITTLYPLPEASKEEKGVYVSAGHLQMMTDPIKPLGMYFFRSVISSPPSHEIGGRLYVDITGDLSTFFGRKMTKYLLNELGDELITKAAAKVIADKELISSLPKGRGKVFDAENTSGPLKIMYNAYKVYKQNDSNIVKDIIAREEEAIRKMGQELQALSGDAVFEYIEQDHADRRLKIASPLNAGVLTAGVLSTRSFDKKIKKWTGVTNAADSIIMSIPNSITTETGLSLMDVTDVIRKHEAIIEYLKQPKESTFIDDIRSLEGGNEVYEALMAYLSQYGMRCSGDIDITVPRWIENPIELVPSILNNLKNFEVGASKHKFEEGQKASDQRIQDLVGQVEKLPGGKRKAKKIRRMASVIRNYIGFREYPKFSFVKRYYIYKVAMLKEVQKLLDKGLIDELEDIYYLYFDELRAMVNGQTFEQEIIAKRKNDYQAYEKLTPPRVMTSDGEVIVGDYDTGNIPDGSLPGLAVSAGVVEGRARIVKDLKNAYLSEGDILVTEFTDPSWTPTFVSIKGLITEVGGLSTHGAIIAREYGLPAVVSVRDATKLIRDGQMIRLNGTEGYIEFL